MNKFVINFKQDDEADNYYTGEVSPFGPVWSGVSSQAKAYYSEDIGFIIEELLEGNFFPLVIEQV